jgi:predicted ester cyclase
MVIQTLTGLRTLGTVAIVGSLLMGSPALGNPLAPMAASEAMLLADMHGKSDMSDHEDHMEGSMDDMDMMDMGASHHLHMDLKAVQGFYDLINNSTDPDFATNAAAVIDVNWKSEPMSRSGDGLTGFIQSVQGLGQMIPDVQWTPQEILKDGNRYIVRSIATGTPVKPFLGVQPTGNSFEVMSIDIHTVENGKIVHSYHVEEWAKAVQQLQAP